MKTSEVICDIAKAALGLMRWCVCTSPNVLICPWCNCATETSHATTADCIRALEREVDQLRKVVQRHARQQYEGQPKLNTVKPPWKFRNG